MVRPAQRSALWFPIPSWLPIEPSLYAHSYFSAFINVVRVIDEMPLHWSMPTQIANFTVLFLLAASLSARAPMLSQAEQSTFPTTNVIEPYSLPVAYPLSLKSQDAGIQDQIRNTLAHYPLAIDGKNFDALDLVFTEDAVANYSAPLNVLRGLSQIQFVLKQSLAPVLSQHAYGTQVIEILEGSRSAKSVTYYTASQFGRGNKTGKVRSTLRPRQRRKA